MKHRTVLYLSLLALLFCLPFPGNAGPAGAQPNRPAGSPAKKAEAPPPAQWRADSDSRAIPADLPLAGAELGLKLIGTAVGNAAGRSVAIIENQSNRVQGAYRVGDRVGELLIKEIQFRYVIIGTGSGDVILAMGAAGRVGPFPSPQAARLDRGEVRAAIPDYEHLMQEIRVRWHFEDGQPVGFVIYNIAPGSIFERMGLESGDVIVAVNGRPFETSLPVVDFYETIYAGGSLSFDIRRLDRKKDLHVEIQ